MTPFIGRKFRVFALTGIATAVSSLSVAAESQELSDALREISHGFTGWDWAVIATYLIFTTILGALLAGKQATIRDFFLGGRKLPWPAVCGSIIATELSAATFLVVPAIVFGAGKDMTYIQLAIGTIAARFIIGYFFVPAFYEREIYSPYDYMGNRLGERVKNITTGLFMLGAVLAQGARVYIAAKALQVITGTDVVMSIIVIGAISILWTFIGGIRTVIWTDVLQFILFSFGAAAALFFVGQAVDGGLWQAFNEAYKAGKLNMLNRTFDPKEAYTLWCGLFATGWLTLASHGTDQMMAQRMFTCRDAAAARKAIIWSSASQVVTLLLLLVGAGLWAYYQHTPMTAAEQVVVDDDVHKVFAIFIVDAMPIGISGLLMAAIFATAISTLDSVLAALSQSTLSTIYKPFRRKEMSPRDEVRVSRIFVLVWGVAMTAFAISCDAIQRHYDDLIQFALAMAAYTYGALLGVFLMALLPTRRNDLGLLWGVPLSILTVFALKWHEPWAQWLVIGIGVLLVVLAALRLYRSPEKILWVLLFAGLTVFCVYKAEIAWPWHFPIGTAVTFVVGFFVGERQDLGAKNA